VTNPSYSGTTDSFPVLKTLTSTNSVLNEISGTYNAGSRPAGVTITTGADSERSPSVLRR
jgi:hypothetical protein